MRSLCLTQRDFLGFFEGINLGGKIQSRRHAEQEPEPGHDAVAITNAHSCPALSELSRSDLVLWHDPDLTEYKRIPVIGAEETRYARREFFLP